MPISFFEHIVMESNQAPLYKVVPVPDGLADMLLECFTVQTTAFPKSGLAFNDAIPTAIILDNPDGTATFRSGTRTCTVTHAWFSGQYLENVQLELAAPGKELLIVRFNPLYFNHISRLSTQTFRDQLVWNLQDAFGTHAERLLINFGLSSHASEKLDILECFLKSVLKNFAVNHLFQEAIQSITACKGNVQIAELAASLRVSYKWLERNFKQFTGVSPKEFARQQRFIHTYFELLNQPEKDLPEIAMENAFYDQNHFSKEFKKFTGCSPAWFRKHYDREGKRINPS